MHDKKWHENKLIIIKSVLKEKGISFYQMDANVDICTIIHYSIYWHEINFFRSSNITVSSTFWIISAKCEINVAVHVQDSRVTHIGVNELVRFKLEITEKKTAVIHNSLAIFQGFVLFA